MLQLISPKLVPLDHLWHLQLVPWTYCGTTDGPQTNYDAMVGSSLPQLVPRIIQRLLLFY